MLRPCGRAGEGQATSPHTLLVPPQPPCLPGQRPGELQGQPTLALAPRHILRPGTDWGQGHRRSAHVVLTGASVIGGLPARPPGKDMPQLLLHPEHQAAPWPAWAPPQVRLEKAGDHRTTLPPLGAHGPSPAELSGLVSLRLGHHPGTDFIIR